MLAKHLVLIQSHVPLAFSQSALSSVLVREKAGVASANAITKVITARFFITAGAMNSKRGLNYTGSEPFLPVGRAKPGTKLEASRIPKRLPCHLRRRGASVSPRGD